VFIPQHQEEGDVLVSEDTKKAGYNKKSTGSTMGSSTSPIYSAGSRTLKHRIKDELRRWLRPGGRARHYVHRHFSCESFFQQLAERKIRYVVLRWFDDLPQIEPGEDVDLLVADEDLPKLSDLFSRSRTTLPCDVYSLTGLPGSDFRKMAYYPPYLSKKIIERAETLRGVYRVPCKRDHFMSLAFHALYHKGYKSGLETKLKPSTPPKKNPDHDYRAILARLASELSIDVRIDLESLDEYLMGEGWRPPFDMLARLAWWNSWIEDRFFSQGLEVEPELRGVAVFMVRSRAIELGRSDGAETELESHGFQVIHSETLTPEQQKVVALHIRGGNWGKGPWLHSGGLPARVIVAWDPKPLLVDPKTREKYPLLDNGRILRAKVALRQSFLQGLSKRDRFNPMHSADNDVQTWEYLAILLPDQMESLKQKVASLNTNEVQ